MLLKYKAPRLVHLPIADQIQRVPDPIIDGNVAEWEEVNARLGPMPPFDTASASLFDSAYVHPALEKSGLLWEYYRLTTNTLMRLVSGSKFGLDQYVGGLPKSRHHPAKGTAILL